MDKIKTIADLMFNEKKTGGRVIKIDGATFCILRIGPNKFQIHGRYKGFYQNSVFTLLATHAEGEDRLAIARNVVQSAIMKAKEGYLRATAKPAQA
jgi:hypothetical protein